MELTALHGIGPEYARRLEEAGVHDAETLAIHPDLENLAQVSGIPLGRLTALQATAADEVEPAGIVLAVPTPLHDIAQTLHRAWDDGWEDMRGLVREHRARTQSALERRAADVLGSLSGALHQVRVRLASTPGDKRRKAA